MLALCRVPPGNDVGEGGAAADPVESGDRAVAVEADRHPPAPGAHEVANRVPVVAHIQGKEVHTPTVALEDVADDILLFDAATSFGEPERDHRGPAEEIADADRAGSPDPAGGRAAGVGGAGELRGRAVVLGDVRVAFQLAGRQRDGELGERPMGGLAVEAERAAPASGPVEDGDHDDRREDQADEDGVAIPHRSSFQASAAGRATITPISATARSITVTMPKSRSILTSLARSTAKPAVAVTPEASTAAPVRE